jgi:hypothetical protein
MGSWFKNVPYPLFLVNDVREPGSEVLETRDKSFLPKKWGSRFKNVPYPLYLVNDVREPSSEVLYVRNNPFCPENGFLV